MDPDGDSEFRVDDGKLTIVAPGPVHDLSAEEGRMNASRTACRIEGDFIAQVKVSGNFDPGGRQVIPTRVPYHGAGLLLMGDLQTYVWFARSALVRNASKKQYVVITSRNQGRVVRSAEPSTITFKDNVSVYLRIERRGDLIRGAVAVEPGKWHELAPITLPLPDAEWIGVSGVNVSGQQLE